MYIYIYLELQLGCEHVVNVLAIVYYRLYGFGHHACALSNTFIFKSNGISFYFVLHPSTSAGVSAAQR